MSQLGWSVGVQPDGQFVVQFSTAEQGLEYGLILPRQDYLLMVRSMLAPLLVQPDLSLGLYGMGVESTHGN